MSYNTGQGQFGPRGNMWAMIKSLLEGKSSINSSMQSGLGALQVAKATYDFSVDGGAIGTIQPKSSPIIPINAIIMGGVVHAHVAPLSGGAATIALGIGTGAQNGSLKVATAVATYAIGVPLALTPIWASGFFKVSADGKITFTIGAFALTAGKIDAHIVYFMAGE